MRFGGVTATSVNQYDTTNSRLLTAFAFRRGAEEHRGTSVQHVYTTAEVIRLAIAPGFSTSTVTPTARHSSSAACGCYYGQLGVKPIALKAGFPQGRSFIERMVEYPQTSWLPLRAFTDLAEVQGQAAVGLG